MCDLYWVARVEKSDLEKNPNAGEYSRICIWACADDTPARAERYLRAVIARTGNKEYEVFRSAALFTSAATVEEVLAELYEDDEVGV